VTRAIEILSEDVVRTLTLIGCPSVRDLNGAFASLH
jgi:isopentenyl diphosphate isomerase/L-lactate dehydrogenase-like FMN-dependent dehydrogenase